MTCVRGEGHEGHVVEKFVHSPGIHYEQMGKLQFSNRMWTFAFSVDLETLVDRINQVAKELDKAEALCGEVAATWGTYGVLVKRWKTNFEVYRSYIQSLLRSRNRRGLVDGLGSIAKSLFGTMDAEDSRHIYGELSRLEGGQKAAFKSAQRQIQLVNATILQLQRAETEIDANERELQRSITNAWTYMSEKFNVVAARVSLDEHMIAVEAVMNGVIRDVEGIRALARGRFLDSEVIPEEQLVTVLKNTSFPTGYSLPFEPVINGLQELEEVYSLAVQVFRTKIVAVIKVPLVTSETFGVFAVHGIPQKSTDGVYTYLRPSNDLLVIQGASRYASMTSRQLGDCKILRGQYLCTRAMPIQVVNRRSPCEVQMYSHPGRLPETCHPEHVALTHLVLFQMRSGTAWLYVAPTPEEIIIRCDAVTERELLEGSGVLQLVGACEVQTANFSITGQRSSGTQLSLHVHPKLNITFPEEDERILKGLAAHNVTEVPLKKLVQHVDELKGLQLQLGQEKKRLDEAEAASGVGGYGSRPVTMVYLIIIVLSVVGLGLGLAIYCWKRRPCKTKDQPAPEVNWRSQLEERLSRRGFNPANGRIP